LSSSSNEIAGWRLIQRRVFLCAEFETPAHDSEFPIDGGVRGIFGSSSSYMLLPAPAIATPKYCLNFSISFRSIFFRY
jgi:hypothetical protein